LHLVQAPADNGPEPLPMACLCYFSK
jgi:hypothetical protein